MVVLMLKTKRTTREVSIIIPQGVTYLQLSNLKIVGASNKASANASLNATLSLALQA
jgi:hypothetical protein